MIRKVVASIVVMVVALCLILAILSHTTYTGDSFTVRVTGRLVHGPERLPVPQALVMSCQSRFDAEDEYQVPGYPLIIEEWETEVRERRARGELPLLSDPPGPTSGGHTQKDGTFSFLLGVGWNWSEPLIDLRTHRPPARHGVEVLRIEIEGRDPVILDVPEGTWTEHDGEGGLWATWDVGVVEVR